ncbi:MAG: hypothetical protein AVDCRST_MAG88-3541, partial [uncultured Thermomicrobiales bacterium]
ERVEEAAHRRRGPARGRGGERGAPAGRGQRGAV